MAARYSDRFKVVHKYWGLHRGKVHINNPLKMLQEFINLAYRRLLETGPLFRTRPVCLVTVIGPAKDFPVLGPTSLTLFSRSVQRQKKKKCSQLDHSNTTRRHN